jgi:hypothetical protein
VSSKAMVQDDMVTTLPKTRPGATGPSHHNPWLPRILAMLTLPKMIAFGKVRVGSSHLLLPHISASLILSHLAGPPVVHDKLC